MRRFVLIAGLLLSVACSDSETAFADVAGQAFQAGGTPLANITISITCASGAIRRTVTSDAQGRYGVNLESSAASGKIPCVFGAPDLASPVARANALISFGPGGTLHPLQFVDLQPVASR